MNMHKVLGMNKALSVDFRRQAVSALMHPVTLTALGVLLLNDVLFKAMWPGAWIPGKLSDLAWIMFAPPVLAYILSFATLGSLQAQRVAFVAAYAGLPLLYAAFNTFEPVHEVILRVLGFFGGDGPRSPLDPTDSLVIPFAMAAALWVWIRLPLQAQSIRTRLALLAATAAALASVASSYEADSGIYYVGRAASGALSAYALPSFPAKGESYESVDGGLTWTKTSEDYIPLERQDQRRDVDGTYFKISPYSPHIIRTDGTPDNQEVVYSYEHLLSGGNRWMQALDKRDFENRAIITDGPFDLFYDEQSGNLIVAMGLQGVVVVASDGTSTKVAVGPYSPTDFSFGNKVRTFFASLLHREAAIYSTAAAILLTFSFAALALVGPAASSGPRWCFAFAAAISAIPAIFWGVYPQVLEYPWAGSEGPFVVGTLAVLFSGFGLFPLLLTVGGLALARPRLRQLLAVVAATIGMLPLFTVGALVLFETGPGIPNFVAVGLVGLAALVLWAYQKRRQTGTFPLLSRRREP